MNNTQNYWR